MSRINKTPTGAADGAKDIVGAEFTADGSTCNEF